MLAYLCRVSPGKDDGIAEPSEQRQLVAVLLSKLQRMQAGVVLDGIDAVKAQVNEQVQQRPDVAVACLLYTSPSPRDRTRSRMPSSA